MQKGFAVIAITDHICEKKLLGGLTIAAHPFYTGDFEFQTFYLWSRREKLKHLIDAWEMSYRKKVSAEVMTSGLPLIASSDFHRLGHMSTWKTELHFENSFEEIQKCISEQRLNFYYYQA